MLPQFQSASILIVPSPSPMVLEALLGLDLGIGLVSFKSALAGLLTSKYLSPLSTWQARSENTDIPTLLIPAITAADAGFYLCVATSPAGTAQARIQVVVLSGMAPPGLTLWVRWARPSEICLTLLWPQPQVPAQYQSGSSRRRHL